MKKFLILFLLPLFLLISCSNGNSQDFQIPINLNDNAGNVLLNGRVLRIGDIILRDGTVVPVDTESLTDEQKNDAVSVIFYAGNSQGTIGECTLGVGLVQSDSALAWCSSSANAAKEKISSIESMIVGDSSSGKKEYYFTFFGDLDGSDNLEQIGQYLTDNSLVDDTNDSSKYPAFYYAKNYKEQDTKIVGTDFEDNWYLPTIAELFQIRINMGKVNASLKKLGAYEFGSEWKKSWLTSSSQSCTAKDKYSALRVTDGMCNVGSKTGSDVYVCAIRKF